MTQPDTPAPCPFCNSQYSLRMIDNPNGRTKIVQCGSCLAEGPVPHMSLAEHTEAAAIAAWNRRPEPAADAVEAVARAMNENIDAREIAKQEDADAYDDSEPHIQEYWQALARAAIAAMPGAGR